MPIITWIRVEIVRLNLLTVEELQCCRNSKLSSQSTNQTKIRVILKWVKVMQILTKKREKILLITMYWSQGSITMWTSNSNTVDCINRFPLKWSKFLKANKIKLQRCQSTLSLKRKFSVCLFQQLIRI